MPFVQHRFREQPVQLGAIADPAVDQFAVGGGGTLDFREYRVFRGFDRVELAIGTFQIGR